MPLEMTVRNMCSITGGIDIEAENCILSPGTHRLQQAHVRVRVLPPKIASDQVRMAMLHAIHGHIGAAQTDSDALQQRNAGACFVPSTALRAEHLARAEVTNARSSGFVDGLKTAVRSIRGDALVLTLNKEDVDEVQALALSAMRDMTAVRKTFMPTDLAQTLDDLPEETTRTRAKSSWLPFPSQTVQEMLDAMGVEGTGLVKVNVEIPTLRLVFANVTAGRPMFGEIDVVGSIESNDVAADILLDGEGGAKIMMGAVFSTIDDAGTSLAAKPSRFVTLSKASFRMVVPAPNTPLDVHIRIEDMHMAWMRQSIDRLCEWNLPYTLVEFLMADILMRNFSLTQRHLSVVYYDPRGAAELAISMDDIDIVLNLLTYIGQVMVGTLTVEDKMKLHDTLLDTSTDADSQRGDAPWLKATLDFDRTNGKNVHATARGAQEPSPLRKAAVVRMQPCEIRGRLEIFQRIYADLSDEASHIVELYDRIMASAVREHRLTVAHATHGLVAMDDDDDEEDASYHSDARSRSRSVMSMAATQEGGTDVTLDAELLGISAALLYDDSDVGVRAKIGQVPFVVAPLSTSPTILVPRPYPCASMEYFYP